MNVCFARPRLILDGFQNRAGLYDVIESTFARLVVANVLRADESSAASYRVGCGACWQVVSSLAKPINTKIGSACNFRILLLQFPDIFAAMFQRHFPCIKKWRVADDNVGFRPLRGQTFGREQGVGGDEIFIEIVERQGWFADVQFVNRQLAANHHRDFRNLDGKRLNIKAVKVLDAQETETNLAFAFAGMFWKLGVNAFVDAGFQPLHFAIGDVEEISRTTGRVKHTE